MLADLAYFYGRAPRRAALLARRRRDDDRDHGRLPRDRRCRNGQPQPRRQRSARARPDGVRAQRCLSASPTPRNPVPGLTRAQVQDLVAGRVTNWSQVPVRRAPTRSSRRAGSDGGCAAGLRVGVPRRRRHRSPTRRARSPSPRRCRDFVRATPAAWGYVDLALVSRPARDDLRGRALRARDDPHGRLSRTAPARGGRGRAGAPAGRSRVSCDGSRPAARRAR